MTLLLHVKDEHIQTKVLIEFFTMISTTHIRKVTTKTKTEFPCASFQSKCYSHMPCSNNSPQRAYCRGECVDGSVHTLDDAAWARRPSRRVAGSWTSSCWSGDTTSHPGIPGVGFHGRGWFLNAGAQSSGTCYNPQASPCSARREHTAVFTGPPLNNTTGISYLWQH